MSVWVKRKAAVQAEAEAEARAEQDAVIAEQHAALAEKTEEEALAELNLPNPDEMQAGDDFSAFMKSTVPAAFRNRALRNLWTSNPVLANVDMLVDYGEDFTGKNDAFKLVNTVYRVGKGMLPDDVEAVEPEADIQGVPVADVEDEDEDVADEIGATLNEDTDATHAPVLPETAAVEIASPPPIPRRRMRFNFSDGSSSVTRGMQTQ